MVSLDLNLSSMSYFGAASARKRYYPHPFASRYNSILPPFNTFTSWSLDVPLIKGKRRKSKTSNITSIIFNCLPLKIQSLIQRKDLNAPDFSELPRDLVVEILKRLPFIDVIRAKIICSSWKSSADTVLSSGTHARLLEAPWLYIAQEHHREYNVYHGCNIRDVVQPRPHLVKKQKITNDLFYKFSLITSSSGWIIFWDNNTSSFLIFNPLKESSMQIPALDSMSTDDQVLKFVVTNRDPISTEGIVSFCYIKDPYKLLYFDKKFMSWVELEVGVKYQDILWNENRLYALQIENFTINMWSLNMDNRSCSNKRIIRIYNVPFKAPYINCYLVASNKEILLVNTSKRLRHTCKLIQEAYTLNLKMGKLEKFKCLYPRKFIYEGLIVVVFKGVFVCCDARLLHYDECFHYSGRHTDLGIEYVVARL